MTAVECFERGNALYGERRIDEAIAAYRAAISLNPDYAQAHNNLGVALRAGGRLDEAVAACREAVRLQPSYASAWNNLGSMLQRQGDHEAAVAAYEESLRLNPGAATAHYNLGCTLRFVGRGREAADAFRSAVRLKPDFADAYANLGGVLREDGDLEGALASYEHALAIKPDWGGPAAQILFLRREMAKWDDLEARTETLRAAIAADTPLAEGIPPFSMLAMDTTRAEQLRGARRWAAHARLTSSSDVRWEIRLSASAKATADKKPDAIGVRPLRIGYLSNIFHQHATASLFIGLLEAHDAAAVDTTLYSYGRQDAGALRQRLVAACGQFVDVSALPDQGIAARIAADRIDILVDLTGYTQGARTGILAFRPAPVQVQFLGYPGTMGTPLVDYLIADPFIVPAEHFADYDEQIVQLPDCYQPNDPKRIIGPTPSRLAAGLPEAGLVFASFNEAYKITPVLFDVWMNLLRTCDGSVLWLLESNRWATENLLREASARGVPPRRIIFAPRVSNAEHLARLPLADLVLDTYPVNGHTTTSDALWAGVPVLTWAGETFVSRVAGSLIRTMGLAELVTGSLETYERQAHELAERPERLARLRAIVREQRATSPLFDAARFARQLEGAYRRLASRPPLGHN